MLISKGENTEKKFLKEKGKCYIIYSAMVNTKF